mmetsp:Transcript_38312/g.69231  ORF Transcript_38312/g.69231 Transcript_38312/m.69231 type:complete len:206 (-) Transcript_38312:255-872(-)
MASPELSDCPLRLRELFTVTLLITSCRSSEAGIRANALENSAGSNPSAMLDAAVRTRDGSVRVQLRLNSSSIPFIHSGVSSNLNSGSSALPRLMPELLLEFRLILASSFWKARASSDGRFGSSEPCRCLSTASSPTNSCFSPWPRANGSLRLWIFTSLMFRSRRSSSPVPDSRAFPSSGRISRSKACFPMAASSALRLTSAAANA